MLTTLRKKKGQSTLEYIILVTAVIVVVIAFVIPKNSMFKQALNSTMGESVSAMNQMGARVHGAFNTN